jgi:hypothetical protein
MQVTSVELKKNGNTAKHDQTWKRYYTRTWIVLTDDPRVGAGSVLAATPVSIGQTYDTGTEHDTGAFCASVSASPTEEDGMQWEVTAEYGPYDATEFPENPQLRDPEISWEYQRSQEAADREAGDPNADPPPKPVKNSAGDSFDPPLLKDVRRPILKLVRNEANFDPLLAYFYHDKVNSTPFFGADPGFVKVEGITPQRVFSHTIGWYWSVQYEFLFDFRGQDPQVLNQGFKRLDANGQRVLCTDDNGEVVTTPVWLDEEGQQIPPDGEPVYLQFAIYERIDFSFLNFDAFYQKLTGYSGFTSNFTGA